MRLHDKYHDIYVIHMSGLRLEGVEKCKKPSFIVFSAIPGSGKSELSRVLEHNYNYLLITNKLIRESILKSGHKDIEIGDYTIWFLNKLTKSFRANIVFGHPKKLCVNSMP